MPDMYAYVDPVGGNNGTAVISATPATAAALPYQTLVAAEIAGRQNLTTMGGDFHFRCLQGHQTSATGFILSSATWPGSTSTRRLIFEGFGTGIHDGTFSTSVGFTFTHTPPSTLTFNVDDVHTVFRDFRLRRTDDGDLIQHQNSGTSQVIERMILDTSGGSCVRPEANTGAGQTTLIDNCAMYSRNWRCILVGSTNDNAITIQNCTLLNNHATNAALEVVSLVNASWNYCANMGAGPAYGGTGWATSTRNKNASDDTTGDATYQNIAAATGSGTRFTSLTANAENFDIGSASGLKNLATDSSLTIDILNRNRSTPDIGAFEEQTGGGTTLVVDSMDIAFEVQDVALAASSSFSLPVDSLDLGIAPKDIQFIYTFTAGADVDIAFAPKDVTLTFSVFSTLIVDSMDIAIAPKDVQTPFTGNLFLVVDSMDIAIAVKSINFPGVAIGGGWTRRRRTHARRFRYN